MFGQKNIMKEPLKSFNVESYTAPGHPINKENAKFMLSTVNSVFKANGIELIIAYGTLLGAVREHDFITHDEDVDTLIWAKNVQKAFDIVPELEKYGITLRSYCLPWIFSFDYKGEGLDVDILQEPVWPWNKRFCLIQGKHIPRKFFENTAPLEFLGEKYTAPANPEKVLAYVYGKDWRIPSGSKGRSESYVFFLRYAHRFAQRCIRYAKRHWLNKGNK